ncbi:SpoIIE family protein phosphatase [Streptomyces sp. t39]|uniref:SpoIIE family protein phosphatase n=1 Tax=Streptomyces sp. t39 TaxID=1828156 RepID=UPI0011CDD099|nr:SpoIIE family protein phosphatase [Streptomyces sp. t39]TXS52703.1 GAF domain-containing protein [Streptomyces sp. t39]
MTVDPLDSVLLDALSGGTGVRLYALDDKLRIVRADSPRDSSSAAADEEFLLGRHFAEVYPVGGGRAEMEELLAGVLRRQAHLHRHLRGRRALAQEREGTRTYSMSFHPLGDPAEPPTGIAVLVADVTEQECARARAASLDAVRRRVGQSLDLAATCEDLVQAVVPGFADIAVVEIVDEVLRGAEAPSGPLGRDTPLRRTAFAGPDDGEPAHPVGDVRSMPHPSPYSLALSDLRPRLLEVGPDSGWLAGDPPRARSIAEYGSHSLIVLPLTLRGTVLGLLSLYRRGGNPAYTQEDVSFATTLATHTAVSIDNARRYQREHTIASTVQRRLLPPDAESRALVAVEAVHAYLPGRNSGCWFDTIPLSGARTALVVGQVKGHGIHTAAVMGQLRTAVQTLAALDLEPDELLARLNDTARVLDRERHALPVGDGPSDPLEAACLYAVYDPFSRRCTMARSGHPVPVVVAPDGRTATLNVPEGPALASSDRAPFGTLSAVLEPGSLVALYSGSRVLLDKPGTRPLSEVLTPPDRPLRALCDALVYNFPAPELDGAVVLLARTGSFASEQQATWELAHDLRDPGAARALAREQLTAWRLPDETVGTVELVVSELVTNAVRHGTAPVTLRLIRTSSLTCEVHDTSPSAPHLRHAQTVDEGGRGLFIVSQLASAWGTRYTGQGKTIWAEVPLPS